MKPAMAAAVLASFVALGCNSCGNAPDAASLPPVPAASPSAPATVRPEANGPEANRAFYPLFAKGGHAGAAMARAQFSSDLRGLPETSSHPGKRPWTRDEVLDRLDEMAKKAPAGLEAMGAYAKARASEEIDYSDPASAVGGGPEAGLGAFNRGAMNLLIGKVRELGEATKTPEDIVAVYTQIATIPLPIYSNSGGATDGSEQREVLAKELRHAVGTKRWAETDAARGKITFKSNK
ncbi:MAG: hypothetical protein JST00_10045 [Deltaproteobacteria bacterium]|nr:hypothetical protein [Deltaproteobacteria bacterium]